MQSLAYGIGTLIASIGPVLMGTGIMTWLVIFVGIDMGLLIICCLFGAWKSLKAPTRRLQRAK
jgi:1,4-dihydroxy-2-naphthoate octaprenyltransferase